MVRISIDWQMSIPFDLIKAGLEAQVPFALEQAAEHVRKVAVERTPNVTGGLAGSAGVTVTGAGIDSVADIKYPGPFAAYQNRGARWDGSHVIRDRTRGRGQTGFLTQTMVDQREAVLEIIAQVMRELS